MEYQKKLLKLETFIKDWDYLSEVLLGWDKVKEELTFIQENPDLDEDYVLNKLQICKDLIENSIRLIKRKK